MNDADAITARRQAWLEAFAAEDIPTMTEFMTEDHVGMPPNQPRIQGRAGAQEFWRQASSVARSSLTIRAPELIVSGDLAVDRFDWDMSITPHDGGPGTQDSGACVWVWRRDADGAWRVRMAIWNSDLDEPRLWSGG